MQKSKMAVWGGLTNSCEKKRSEKKREKERYKHLKNHVAAAVAKSPQSCPTLWDPTDSSPLGSSVPGILQGRTLEWVAISFSNA